MRSRTGPRGRPERSVHPPNEIRRQSWDGSGHLIRHCHALIGQVAQGNGE
ncbi:MAG: hypothetical protein DRP71_11910, partial [Verrucomicrobia bacterium]